VQCANAAGAFGLVGFRQDVVFVLSGEAAALGLGHDLGVGADLWVRAGFAVLKSPLPPVMA
jgi:hypothetical protein